MASGRKYTCGVPQEKCSGGKFIRSKGLEKEVHKCHNSPQEAFACAKRYLLSIGYRIAPDCSRHLLPPEGSGLPIRLLPKQSHFGGVLRKGKAGEKSTGGKRLMPRKGPRRGCKGGICACI